MPKRVFLRARAPDAPTAEAAQTVAAPLVIQDSHILGVLFFFYRKCSMLVFGY